MAYLTLIVVVNFFLYINYSMSIAGYWSERIIIWLWIILTVYLIGKNWYDNLAQASCSLLIFLIVLSMIPMMIPFLAIMNIITCNDRIFVRKLGENMRIQIMQKSPVVGQGIEIVEQGYILEKAIVQVDAEIRDIRKAKSIKILKNTKDSLKLEFIFSDKKIFESYRKRK
jgi:hypothetical protein